MSLPSVSLVVRRLRERADRVHVAVVLLIFALAVVFRLRNLGAPPFWIDEAHSAWAARNFLAGEGFSDAVGRSSPYLRARFTTSLPIAVSFALFGISEFAARLPMVGYGLLTVGVAYLLGAHFHRLAGYMLATFVAVEPFIVVWSRTARMYAPLTLLYLTTLYIVVRWFAHEQFDIVSPYPVALGALAILGLHTHRAYLAVGAVVGLFFCVTAVDGLRPVHRGSLGALDDRSRRAGLLCAGVVVAAIGYILVRGVPGVITDSPPGGWPERGFWFYWGYLGQTYIFLRYVAVVGAAYLWIRYEAARLLILAVVVPFLVASLTPRKAPRFIVHLMPVVGALALLPIADAFRFIWSKLTEETESVAVTDLALSSVGPLFVLLILAVPFAGFAVADATYDPPHQPDRSDWSAASEFVDQKAAENDLVASTRPELSLWYFGRTEYFFRQRGIGRAVGNGNGTYVHARTGTIYLNETADVEQLLDRGRPVWLFAGKKFRNNDFTDSRTRQLVESEFDRVGDPDWVGMQVYYYSPDGSSATEQDN